METDVLRVFTANYIAESDIDGIDKLELLEFVKIADREDLFSFLAFGEPTEVTTENQDLIIETEEFVGEIIDEGAKDFLKKAKDYTKGAASKAKSAMKAAPGKAKSAMKAAPGKAYASTKKTAGAVKDLPSNVKAYKKMKGANDQVRANIAKQNIKRGAVGVVAVAAVAAAAYMAYKRYASKGAKACAGRKGTEKVTCMSAYKKQATRAQISVLQGGLGKCSSAKNPEKCKASIQNKIASLKAKAA